MNVNTTTKSLTQNDLNSIIRDNQDYIRYQDLVLLADLNDLSVEDALFSADQEV